MNPLENYDLKPNIYIYPKFSPSYQIEKMYTNTFRTQSQSPTKPWFKSFIIKEKKKKMKERNNMNIWGTSACQSLATSYRPQLTRKKEKEKEKEKKKKGIG